MFKIFISDCLIGHSKLEAGDPPMGVALGKFIPTEEFLLYDTHAIKIDDETRHWYNLRAITPSGVELKCDAISLAEYDISLTTSEPDFYFEVSCLGVISPPYEELFPHHIEESEARLKSSQ